jgi:transposase-like protein
MQTDTPERITRNTIRKTEMHEVFPLAALEAAACIRRYLDEVERRAVETARSRGATWEDIAEALGVSRQAVYQRFRHRLVEAPAVDQAARGRAG